MGSNCFRVVRCTKAMSNTYDKTATIKLTFPVPFGTGTKHLSACSLLHTKQIPVDLLRVCTSTSPGSQDHTPETHGKFTCEPPTANHMQHTLLCYARWSRIATSRSQTVFRLEQRIPEGGGRSFTVLRPAKISKWDIQCTTASQLGTSSLGAVL